MLSLFLPSSQRDARPQPSVVRPSASARLRGTEPARGLRCAMSKTQLSWREGGREGGRLVRTGAGALDRLDGGTGGRLQQLKEPFARQGRGGGEACWAAAAWPGSSLPRSSGSSEEMLERDGRRRPLLLFSRLKYGRHAELAAAVATPTPVNFPLVAA